MNNPTNWKKHIPFVLVIAGVLGICLIILSPVFYMLIHPEKIPETNEPKKAYRFIVIPDNSNEPSVDYNKVFSQLEQAADYSLNSDAVVELSTKALEVANTLRTENKPVYKMCLCTISDSTLVAPGVYSYKNVCEDINPSTPARLKIFDSLVQIAATADSISRIVK